ncbi:MULTISPECIES: GrpB family protein [Crateriforma]|uniref:Dephospho-CoA kinase/protein folding accessory domain-containing protein n=1 Tax=Crateriforma conspicua TaxID=2527996 RepID=A0A5C6FT36_9PLAN|nr:MULTISPECIES: GrpB family protein [Crateriforma]TWU63351.1 dephospho-CoA kinase/protein folding accessory domain-containing protein [Crateriforma conspicua]
MDEDADLPIRLSHHDPRWRQEFQQIRSGVLQCGQGMITQVEHIGGTALPGRISQPIIDVLAGVHDANQMDEAALSIEGLYFRPLPPPHWDLSAVRLIKPRGGPVTHQLFLMPIGTPAWHAALAIRDHLRSDTEASLRFEDAKVGIWKRTGGDPEDYPRAKDGVFTHLMEQLNLP